MIDIVLGTHPCIVVSNMGHFFVYIGHLAAHIVKIIAHLIYFII